MAEVVCTAKTRPVQQGGANIAGDGKLQCACSSVQETRGPVGLSFRYRVSAEIVLSRGAM